LLARGRPCRGLSKLFSSVWWEKNVSVKETDGDPPLRTALPRRKKKRAHERGLEKGHLKFTLNDLRKAPRGNGKTVRGRRKIGGRGDARTKTNL